MPGTTHKIHAAFDWSEFEDRIEKDTLHQLKLENRLTVRQPKRKAAACAHLVLAHLSCVAALVVNQHHVDHHADPPSAGLAGSHDGDTHASVAPWKALLIALAIAEISVARAYYAYCWLDHQTISGFGPLSEGRGWLGVGRYARWVALDWALTLLRPCFGTGGWTVALDHRRVWIDREPDPLYFEQRYTADALLTTAALLASFRTIVLATHETYRLAKRLSHFNRYNISDTIGFSLRRLMMDRPFMVPMFLGLYLVLLLGAMVFVAEGVPYAGEDPDPNPLASIANCCWLITTTLSTVGYGDLYPRTHLGRVWCLAAFILGNFVCALLFGVMGGVLQYSPSQTEFMTNLEVYELHLAYNKAARHAVDAALRCYLWRFRLNKLRGAGAAEAEVAAARGRVRGFFQELWRELSAAKQCRRDLMNWRLGSNDNMRYMLQRIYSAIINPAEALAQHGSHITATLSQSYYVNEHADRIHAKRSMSERLGLPPADQSDVAQALSSISEALKSMSSRLDDLTRRTAVLEEDKVRDLTAGDLPSVSLH